jgi:pimeloyl-ACP methyl ester carboxylesterase
VTGTSAPPAPRAPRRPSGPHPPHPPHETLPVPVDLGAGPPIVLLGGFGLHPRRYRATATLLARRAHVLVPDLFGLPGAWVYQRVLHALGNTLAARDLAPVTFVGHSFGGSLELGYAARHPDRVVELVFTDTLAVAREWSLAEEALSHPTHLVRMATPAVAIDFISSCVTRPRQLAEAGWWAFRRDGDDDMERVAAAGHPTHVLWANRDSLLSRTDGARFADDLHASFTVVQPTIVVDHDWMYRHPELFVSYLDRLNLVALR